MKLHQATARALKDYGIDTMFGLIGDANMFMVNAFVQEQGCRFIPANSEAGAVLMAVGYAQTTGRPGVVSVTHGPGVSNSLTGLVEARKAGLPLLFLCGDTPAVAKAHFQNVPQRELIVATGAGFEQVRAPETVIVDLATALRRSILERKPIALNIPADFEWVDVEYSPIKMAVPENRPTIVQSPEMDNAVGIIASARAPIVLAGRGASSAEAESALLRLAERTGALLATTLKGRGLFSGDPHHIGIYGTLSTPLAGDIIRQSDCIIAFGASLNRYTAAKGPFFEGKRIIQCNLDADSVGAEVTPDAGLVGDPEAVAESIMHWLDTADIPPSGFRQSAALNALATSNPFADLPDTATKTTVDLTRSLLKINDAAPADKIFVCDVGRYVGQAWKSIDVCHPSHYVHTVHFGAIGLGLPCAIGAAVAHPNRTALLVTGDGGFVLGGLQEFHTAVRLGLKLVVVVCNDGSYGAEHVQLVDRGLDPSLALFDWPEFASVATALGGDGFTVRNRDDLDAACAAIGRCQRPLLIDLKLDPDRMVPLDY